MSAHTSSPQTERDVPPVGRRVPLVTGRWTPPRPRARTIVWIALGIVAAYVLVPQADALLTSIRTLRDINPVWLGAGLGLVALRYAMAALSLQVVVNSRIPFASTLLVQLASSFVGRFTPEGVGWLVLNQRYLERSGVGRSSALAAIALKILAGGLTRLVIAAVVAAIVGARGLIEVDLPTLSPLPVAVAGLAVVIGITLAWLFRGHAERIVVPTAAALRDLRVVLAEPRRGFVLLGSTAALTLTYALALAVAVAAFGAQASLVSVFAVYLGATAVAALSPTPGNLGAIEVALTAGLTAIDVPGSSAIGAVLLFRLWTFWLPVLPGFLAFRHLQKRDLL